MEQLLQLDFFQGALPLQVVIGILVCIGILAFVVFIITMAINEFIIKPISGVVYDIRKRAQFENTKKRFSINAMVNEWAEQYSEHIIRVIKRDISDYQSHHWKKNISKNFRPEYSADSIRFSGEKIRFCEIGLASLDYVEVEALAVVMNEKIVEISRRKLNDLGFFDYHIYTEDGEIIFEIPNPAYVEPKAW